MELAGSKYRGEEIVRFTSVFKAKYGADGKLAKLKTRFPIRGDQDSGAMDEDNHVPLAKFRTLLIFLADAAANKARVYQLDYIGAYLSAEMDRLVYVMFDAGLAQLAPQYKDWLGVPLIMKKTIYGGRSCGRLFAEKQFGWLVDVYGFVQCKTDPAVFIWKRGNRLIKLLTYCDDCAYWCSDEKTRRQFEKAISKAFQV